MAAPNLLLILSDQHRASSVGAYGNPDVQTPNLDRMAEEGVRYINAVSIAPICAPARASIQTGLYPHQHGVTHNGAHLRPDVPTLADDLAAAGYRTAYIGKCHWHGKDRPGYVPPTSRLGWQHWFGYNRGHFYYDTPTFDASGTLTHELRGRYEPAVQVDHALAFIERTEAPWAMQLNLGPPHTATMEALYTTASVRNRMKRLNHELGFDVPEDELFARPESWFPQALVGDLVPREFLDRYDPAALELQPNVATELAALARYSLREYYAMVTAIDEQIGRLLAALRGTNTVVIYTSDHGDQVGSHTRMPRGRQAGMPEQGTRTNKNRAKGRPLQNSYRVPYIHWHATSHTGGRTDATPTTTVDIRPTLRRLAGLEPSASLPGVPVVPDEPSDRPAVVFGLADWRARFDGRYCYVASTPEGAAHGPLAPLHLFDTEADPYDLDDLCRSEAHTSVRERFHAELLASLRTQRDPMGDSV